MSWSRGLPSPWWSGLSAGRILPYGAHNFCPTRRSVMSKPPILRAERLCKTYPDGRVNALVEVNLTIGQSDYIAVMGPSGCGKSTLLNVLGALDRPDSGDVYFEGRPLSAIRDLDRFRSKNLGF